MDIRASDAERDATVDRLREAAAEGRLTLEDLTDRIEAARRRGDALRTRAAHVRPAGPVAIVVPPQAMPTANIRAVGDVKRAGTWTVEAENSFRTWFGHIKLDLRQAQIGATETHIYARAMVGNVVLLVPDGVEVEVQARTQVGRTNCTPAPGYLGRRASCSPAERSSATSRSATAGCGRSWGAGADSPSSPRCPRPKRSGSTVSLGSRQPHLARPKDLQEWAACSHRTTRSVLLLGGRRERPPRHACALATHNISVSPHRASKVSACRSRSGPAEGKAAIEQLARLETFSHARDLASLGRCPSR